MICTAHNNDKTIDTQLCTWPSISANVLCHVISNIFVKRVCNRQIDYTSAKLTSSENTSKSSLKILNPGKILQRMTSLPHYFLPDQTQHLLLGGLDPRMTSQAIPLVDNARRFPGLTLRRMDR